MATIPSTSWYCASCIKCKSCNGYDHPFTIEYNTSDSMQLDLPEKSLNTFYDNQTEGKYSPVWGSSIDICQRCTDRQFSQDMMKLKAEKKLQKLEHKEKIMKLENMSIVICSACHNDCSLESAIQCPGCSSIFHMSCLGHLTDSWIEKDCENFRCHDCLDELADLEVETHLGKGKEAIELLSIVSTLQRKIYVCNLKSKIDLDRQEFHNKAIQCGDNSRLAFKVNNYIN
jgi:hypothetical protein